MGPITIAISILRYRLWDIDPLINRSLVYFGLTASVVGLYVLIVGSFSALFQTSNNLLVSLLATSLVAVIFQPLRHRLQRGVNRLMYGERDDPYAVLSHLGQRLKSTLTPDAVLPTIVETVALTLKLPYAALVLKPLTEKTEEQFETVAVYGQPTTDAISLALTYQGETIGELRLALRAPGEPFTPAERRLLDDIAQQAGVAAHVVRLSDALQRSREKIITAREEERRRLRRDLHDGLGPLLAGLALQLDAVRGLMSPNQEADDLVDELKDQLHTAITGVRRVVYGLRPPVLDELGLLAALREYAVRYNLAAGLEVTIEGPEPLPALPAAVEVAAYRVAVEGLTNVMRHARAQQCCVRFELLEADPPGADTARPALQVEIIDDGRGLQPDHRPGVGFFSMRERAAELGGLCLIENNPAGGTRVLARLPLPRGQAASIQGGTGHDQQQ